MNRATFKPPWTGVKRKLTFYDLKCEFYRYCAPSNGNYRHKQLKRRDAKNPFSSLDPNPIHVAARIPISIVCFLLHSCHIPVIILKIKIVYGPEKNIFRPHFHWNKTAAKLNFTSKKLYFEISNKQIFIEINTFQITNNPELSEA